MCSKNHFSSAKIVFNQVLFLSDSIEIELLVFQLY